MRDLVRVFRALSDETRVRILKLLLERSSPLEKKSLCVCEIMQALNISQTRASRNLGILEEAGFVLSERKGSWVHYSINRSSTNEYCKSIEKLLKDWLNEDTQIMEDKKRLSKAVKLGGGNDNKIVGRWG